MHRRAARSEGKVTMRLAKLTEFRKLVYSPNSAPCLNSLRSRISRIPGGTILDGRYYVDLDEFDRANGLRSGIADQQQTLAKNSLLEGLI
jgi:hypothetical protein